MAIKITAQEPNGSLVMECFNCSKKESSKQLGMFIEWKNFNRQREKTTCHNCGHSDLRQRLGFAKKQRLETIHLCSILDGYYFSARCGTMSGDFFSSHEIIEAETLTINNKMCKKCAREEGVNSIKWYSSLDKEIELEFYRYL